MMNVRWRPTFVIYDSFVHAGWWIWTFFSTFIPLDKDECALKTHRCHAQATCNNILGSYSCTCNIGFTGNGTICKGTVIYQQIDVPIHLMGSECYYSFFKTAVLDQDECLLKFHSCHFNATCTNTIGSYTCTCNDGFLGNGTMCIGRVNHTWIILIRHQFECTTIYLSGK